jgi:hypothetical protein
MRHHTVYSQRSYRGGVAAVAAQGVGEAAAATPHNGGAATAHVVGSNRDGGDAEDGGTVQGSADAAALAASQRPSPSKVTPLRRSSRSRVAVQAPTVAPDVMQRQGQQPSSASAEAVSVQPCDDPAPRCRVAAL